MKKTKRKRVEETTEIGHGNPYNMRVVEDKAQARVVWPTTPSSDFIYATSLRISRLATTIRGA